MITIIVYSMLATLSVVTSLSFIANATRSTIPISTGLAFVYSLFGLLNILTAALFILAAVNI